MGVTVSCRRNGITQVEGTAKQNVDGNADGEEVTRVRRTAKREISHYALSSK